MEAVLALFDTAIGRCGLAWTSVGVAGFQLPEATDEATLARLRRRHAGLPTDEPPSPIAAAIEGIRALLKSGRTDLSFIVLDETGVPDFHRRIYALLRQVPAGETRTYGQLAKAAGEPGAAQAVGQAMGRNPWPVIVPCHRVLAAGGQPGGFTAPGGLVTKARLLEIEGVALRPQGDLFG